MVCIEKEKNMEYKKSYKLHLSAEQCRKIIRLDLPYNFAGVTKSEIDENHFQFKGLAVNTGSIWKPNLGQIVSILLVENPENNSTSIVIKSTPVLSTAYGDNWQNALEQLVGIVWNDIYRAADLRYPNAADAIKPKQKIATVQAEERHSTPEEIAESDILETGENKHLETSESDGSYETSNQIQQQAPIKSKKNLWIGIAVAAVAVILAIVYLPQLFGGGNKTYKYSSQTGVVIEMTLDGGYDRGSYSLRVYNPNVYGRDNTYTGNYWTNGTTVNSYENFAITGYEFAQFYISSDRSKLIIDCYTGSGSLYITYTLSLQ